MTDRVHVVGYGREASDALAEAVRAAKGDDPLAPVTVIVPSNFTALTTRRLLGREQRGVGPAGTVGIANVGFVTPFRLAELLGSDLLLDRRPLTNPVIGAAVRLALADDPGPFKDVRDHIATQTALAELHGELSNVSEGALRRIEGHGRMARTAVGFHRAIAKRLEGFHDEAALALAAARRPDLPEALAPLGHLVLHLPEPTTAPMCELLAAVMAAAPTSAVVGLTGAADADARVLAACRRMGIALESAEREPATAAAIVSVSDADEEVRAVVRRIAALAEEGVPLERIGVFYPTPDPYLGMLEQQLAAAGLPSNGPSRRRLSGSVAGRTLLAALELPAHRWRRDRVMALVSGAPVRHQGSASTPSQWEAISRAAGVVQHLGDWTGKLAGLRRDLQEQLATLDGGDPRAAAIQRELDDLDRLASFVTELHAAVGAVEQAPGWIKKAAAARSLLRQLLKPTADWPESEVQSFERVEDAITRLATLADLEESPSHAMFVTALTAELDVSQGRNGRFGHGIGYGPLASAAGQDLDAVFLLGCVEDLCPAPRRDDAMLPDAARALADGELPLRADRLGDQHRTFLAALAAAPPDRRTLTVPRSDLRGGRVLLPSRWLLDTASALADKTVHTTEFDELEVDGLEVVPSFASGLRSTKVHASVLERDLAAIAADLPPEQPAHLHPLAASLAGRGLQAQRARRSADFTEWDGNLAGEDIPDTVARPQSPTGLQNWASCGYRYFLGHVLRLSDRDDPERVLDLNPLDRGTAVHKALERFLAEVLETGAPEPHQPWTAEHRRRLFEIGAEELEKLHKSGRTGREHHWRLTRADLLATLDELLTADDDYRAAHGARPHRVELPFGIGGAEPVRIELPDGRTLQFRGQADRVDVTTSTGHRVIDYKTGNGKKFAGLDKDDPVRGGTLLQLGLYAEAAIQLLGATEVESHYWVVDRRGSYKRHGYPWTADRRERMLEVLTAIVDGIEAGVFPVVPGDRDTYFGSFTNCRHCDFDQVCASDRLDHAERKIDAPELRRRDALLWVVDGEAAEGDAA